MYAGKIRENRLRMNLSQQALGEKLGISSVAVSKWERGQSQPDIPTLAKLADIFGLSLDELCGHQAPPSKDENMTVMTRAFGRLTREEQDKFLAVGRALFAHAFPPEEKP
ncbi:MAG: helix-turn-helix transcriptional regulator [Christensenellaceae bacterium]|nr:helix-turn-helix transcriptional regulator [Christensenellaceae bacterium]